MAMVQQHVQKRYPLFDSSAVGIRRDPCLQLCAFALFAGLPVCSLGAFSVAGWPARDPRRRLLLLCILTN